MKHVFRVWDWMIWGGCILFACFYLTMPLFMKQRTGSKGWIFIGAAVVVAIVTAAISLLMRRYLIEKPILSGKLDPEKTIGALLISIVNHFVFAIATTVSIYGLALWYNGESATFVVAGCALTGTLLWKLKPIYSLGMNKYRNI